MERGAAVRETERVGTWVYGDLYYITHGRSSGKRGGTGTSHMALGHTVSDLTTKDKG